MRGNLRKSHQIWKTSIFEGKFQTFNNSKDSFSRILLQESLPNRVSVSQQKNARDILSGLLASFYKKGLLKWHLFFDYWTASIFQIFVVVAIFFLNLEIHKHFYKKKLYDSLWNLWKAPINIKIMRISLKEQFENEKTLNCQKTYWLFIRIAVSLKSEKEISISRIFQKLFGFFSWILRCRMA